MRTCPQCGDKTVKHPSKYCSNKCQLDYQHGLYIYKWKQGLTDGSRGKDARNISRHIKRYLLEKYGQACSVCGWSDKHPITGNVPLEIDHIDGKAENNEETNLRLICPNCHALTPNYRNLNKGSGRDWRRAKYIRVS